MLCRATLAVIVLTQLESVVVQLEIAVGLEVQPKVILRLKRPATDRACHLKRCADFSLRPGNKLLALSHVRQIIRMKGASG